MVTKILFVCLGNICRSPCAEAIMRAIIKQNNNELTIFCDSAGIIDYHAGELADERMRSYAFQRGYNIDSISRPFCINDFQEFDLIIGMDSSNVAALLEKDVEHKYKNKIKLVTQYQPNKNIDHVPDPYYGGREGFINVINILEESCTGLYQSLI